MKHLVTSLLLLGAAPLFAQSYGLSPVFGHAGTLRLDTWPGDEIPFAHILTDDGRLIVAGTGYWNSPNSFRVPIAVLDTGCGVLDTSFSHDGIANVFFEQRTFCRGLAAQADGKIIGCGVNATSNGVSAHKPSVFRLNPDGTPDSTFNGTGFHKSPFDGISSGGFWNVFTLPDGRITCVGGSSFIFGTGGSNALGAQRFMPDGSLDATFGQGGIARIPIPLSWDPTSVDREQGTGMLLPDGGVLAAGISVLDGERVLLMAHFDTTGAADTTFGNGGLVNTGLLMGLNSGTSNLGMRLLPDERFLVSGPDSDNGFLMARFLPNGDLDSTYGVDGSSLIEPAVQSQGFAMDLLPDGSTLQFGAMHWANDPPCIVKRTMDGMIDTTFGNNGIQVVQTMAGTNHETFHGGLTMPSGRIIAYGKGQGDSDNGGTMLIARVTIDPQAERFVDLGGDVAVCSGDSVELDAGPGQSWAWSDGSTNQTLFVSTPMIVQVTVTDAQGCMDSDQVEVSFTQGPDVPVITAEGTVLSTAAVGDLQWFLNGTAIPGADQGTYTTTANGDYTVSVTDSAGCSTFSTIVNVTTVGIAETNAAVVRVYPNPASGTVTLSGTVPGSVRHVEVLDAAGRPVRSAAQASGSGLDVSRLAAGSYALVIQLRNGQRVLRKLMVR